MRRPRVSTCFAARLLGLPRAIAGRVVAHAVYWMRRRRAPGPTSSRSSIWPRDDPAGTGTSPSGLKARRDREYVRLSRPSPRDGEADPPRPGKGKA